MSGIINLNNDETKKFLLNLTIGLLSFCAFVGIIAIFVGNSTGLWQVVSTALIIYFMTVFSSTNIMRLNGASKGVKVCAVITLISNVFCGIPWILLVWGVFGNLSVSAILDIWRVIWTFGLISVFCTVLARNIPRIKNAPSTLFKLYSSISTVFATFICVDLLLFIWEVFDDIDLLVKFIFAELILVLLQFAVSKILLHNQQSSNSPSDSDSEHSTISKEAALHQQIEAEVRAKITAEQADEQEDKETDKQPSTTEKPNN